MREELKILITSIINKNIDIFKEKNLDLKSLSSFLTSKISSDFVYINGQTAAKYKDEIIEVKYTSNGLYRKKNHGLYIYIPRGIPYFNLTIPKALSKSTFSFIPKIRSNNTIVLISFLKDKNGYVEVILAYVLPKRTDIEAIKSLEKFIYSENMKGFERMKISAKHIFTSNNESEKNNIMFWSLKGKELKYYLEKPTIV